MQAGARVVTKSAGRAHLVFVDAMSVTLGPDSELMIDRFSYDPDHKSGEMALTVRRGAFQLASSPRT